MNEKTLTVVESPFQLLTAVEYFRSSNFDVVFVDLGNERNRAIVHRMSEYLGIHLKSYRRYSAYYRLDSLTAGLRLALCSLRSNRLVLGDFREIHFRLLLSFALFTRKNSVILDDGTSSLFFLDKLEELVRRGSHVFTFFGESKYFEKHNFDYVKNMVDKDLPQRSVVIGSSIVETGSISEKYYHAFLGKIKSNEEIYYVPHRNEAKEKLELISQLYGWEIWTLNVPLELIYLNGYRFNEVYSVSSSALPTLLTLYDDLKVGFFYYDNKWSDTGHGVKMKFIEKELLTRFKPQQNIRLLKV